MLASVDSLRRAQGEALGLLGFGPDECSHHVAASGPSWRLRDYGGPEPGMPLFIVAAPIKRPYIWDLAPSVSAVRYCLRHGFRVYLLEWRLPAPKDRAAGLAEYADAAIGEAIEIISKRPDGARPWLMGHSLGGTLAAIFGILHPETVRGLVLLGAPLCFQPGVSRFRDAIVTMAPPCLAEMRIIPGSLLSQLSALASPETFVWSRLIDAILSSADPLAWTLHARIERWALDEVPLSGRLVHEILQWLYREDRLRKGTLRLGGRILEPSALELPVLVVVNTADEIAPPASVGPFIESMPRRDVPVLEYAGETGVALQHLAILVGRRAHAQVWPEIVSWLHRRP